MDATEQAIDRTFAVGPAAELVLNTVSGNVRIEGGDVREIHVNARPSGHAHVEMQQEGDRVEIRTRHGGNLPGLMGAKHVSVDYDITVPAACAIKVKAVSADVVAGGVRARCEIATVSGDVHVERIDGTTTLTTVSGDVQAEELGGTLHLNTTSGDAEVRDSSLHDFNLHSVSGDFQIETPLARGEHYHANTVSGDLLLTVPAETGVTVQMKTMSGEVISDLRNAEIIKSGRRHWQGRINGGGANVEMQSVSGDLRITAGSAGASAPPSSQHEYASGDMTSPDGYTEAGPEVTAAPQAETGSETRSDESAEVLKLLEQGEIDVDEALSRLQALGR